MDHVEIPETAPPITIEPAPEAIKEVDCPELQFWQMVPRVGDRSVQAFYETYSGQLDYTRHVTSVIPGDGDDTVIMTLEESASRFGPTDAPSASPHDGLSSTYRFTCRLDSTRAQWLRVEVENADGTVTSTAEGDPGFHQHWGDTRQRRLEAGERYRSRPDGTMITTDDPAIGEGTYVVTVADREFTCLRVLDYREPSEEIGESFIDRSGRTVLYRQFRPISWDPDWQTWQQQHPDGLEMTIDSQLFMHRNCTGLSHVVLTSTALGL